MLRKTFFTIAIMLLAMGAEAMAQSPTATMSVYATVYKAITLTKGTELEFGKLAVGQNGGTVTISTNGVREKSGDIALVSSTYNKAAIQINGEAGMPITITMNDWVYLTDGASHELLLELDASQTIGGTIFLDGTGILPVNVGGTVTIPSGSPVGEYTGTVNFSVVYY